MRTGTLSQLGEPWRFSGTLGNDVRYHIAYLHVIVDLTSDVVPWLKIHRAKVKLRKLIIHSRQFCRQLQKSGPSSPVSGWVVFQ